MSNDHTLETIQKLTEKRKSDKIIKYLDSQDLQIVLAALHALSQIADENSVNSITHMIDSSQPEIRKATAEALGNIGTEYAKTYLQHRAATETDASVKEAISSALHVISANR